MRKMLVYYADKCTGCLYCENACTLRHKAECGRNGSLIKLVTSERELNFAAMFCHHCKRPVCAELCPVGAITRNDDIGLVRIDIKRCVGCGECVACPLGGIDMDDDTGLAVNCDQCDGKPACVEFCPAGALQYLSTGEARRLKATAKQL
ncbi:MAG: 4Fe-4S dicluster domain-containing protein [Chloroflexota bacterium]